MPVRIIYLYAHEDEALLDKLRVYLKPLKHQGVIDWYDRNIAAGTEWGQEIDRHISEANVILLLVSPDFLASDYSFGEEMKQVMERHERGKAQIVPVILRPVPWQGTPFGKLKALPTNEIPVTSSTWHNLDEAFLDVAEGIRKVVEQLLEGNIPTPPYFNANILKSSNNIIDFLEKAIRELEDITGTDYNQILLVTTSSHSHHLTVVADVIPPHKSRYRIPTLLGLFGAAYSTGKKINAANVREWPNYVEANYMTRSELVVPIIRESVVLGILNSESEEMAHYNGEIEQTVENLATLLGELLLKFNWHPHRVSSDTPWIQKMPLSGHYLDGREDSKA